MLLRLFQMQVVLQCEAVLAAADAIKPPFGHQTWYSIQSLLTATANLSKLFWGQGGTKARERRPLRDSLQVSAKSALRPTTFRNHFDHFDDRLMTWQAESRSHNYADLNFGDIPNQIRGLKPIEIFRAFDPATGDLIFWGDRYSLPVIVQEVQGLLQRARIEANKPHWDPPSSSTEGSSQ